MLVESFRVAPEEGGWNTAICLLIPFSIVLHVGVFSVFLFGEMGVSVYLTLCVREQRACLVEAFACSRWSLRGRECGALFDVVPSASVQEIV